MSRGQTEEVGEMELTEQEFVERELARMQDPAIEEVDAPPAPTGTEAGRVSRSPSAVSEEDVSFCVNFLAPPAETPSTVVPDDSDEVDDISPKPGSRCESAPPSCEVPEN